MIKTSHQSQATRWALRCMLTWVLAASFGVETNAAPAFSTPQNITNTTQDSTDAQVASRGSDVFLVWNDNEIGASVYNPEIYFARSADGGRNFGSFVNISMSPGVSASPRLAVSGPDVYIVWAEASGDFLVHSSDAGVNFGAPVNLTTTYGIQLGSFGSLTASGSNVFLAWQRDNGGANDIFVARSIDKGASFASPQNVSVTAAASTRPKVVASGANVYVAWVEAVSTPVSGSDVFFTRSLDSGVTYETPRNISNNDGQSTAVSLSADGSKVWLAWSDRPPSGTEEILVTRSSNAGENFETARNLSENATRSVEPAVMMRGSQVYVSWTDTPAGDTRSDVYLRSSSDSGSSFDAAANLSNSAMIISAQSKLAIADSAVSVYWLEGVFRDVFNAYLETTVPNPPPVLLSVSPASGQQGQAVDVLITGSGFMPNAQAEVLGSGVAVQWREVTSPEEMKARLGVAMDAPLGVRSLQVVNPDTQAATLPGAFTVMAVSTLSLIEMARVDLNQGMATGGFMGGSSSYKSLLAHLDNAEAALMRQPPDHAAAVNQMDAFYVKIGNLSKGKKPELTPALYQTLYAGYTGIITSLGGTAKPAH